MLYQKSFCHSLALSLTLATVATCTLSEVVRAAQFNLSYTSSVGTITATVEGTLQADNNRVFVTAIGNPKFNGSVASAVPFVGTATSFFGGPIVSPGVLSLNGSGLDFIACTTNGLTGCTDSFIFAPVDLFDPPLFASGGSYGTVGGEDFVLARYSLTRFGSTSVPEPSAVIGLAVMGGVFLGRKWQKSA